MQMTLCYWLRKKMVLQSVTDNCKILWNRNKYGKKLDNEKLEATIPSTDNDT